ncbi:MAG: hypothetical protein AB7G06_02115 [Bdellovibrionales bacterium]
MSSKSFLTGLAVAVLMAAPAMAQNRVLPPLAQVGQLVVAEPLLSDTKVASDCGIDIKKIQQFISNYLTREGLPVIPVADSAQMVRTDVFRLTLRPEIATLKDGVVSCVSWASLKAESQHTVRLPPVVDRKTVTVAYWNRGGLVMTPLVDHMTGMQNAYTILMRSFVQEYRIDNPGGTVPDKIEEKVPDLIPLQKQIEQQPPEATKSAP